MPATGFPGRPLHIRPAPGSGSPGDSSLSCASSRRVDSPSPPHRSTASPTRRRHRSTCSERLASTSERKDPTHRPRETGPPSRVPGPRRERRSASGHRWPRGVTRSLPGTRPGPPPRRCSRGSRETPRRPRRAPPDRGAHRGSRRAGGGESKAARPVPAARAGPECPPRAGAPAGHRARSADRARSRARARSPSPQPGGHRASRPRTPDSPGAAPAARSRRAAPARRRSSSPAEGLAPRHQQGTAIALGQRVEGEQLDHHAGMGLPNLRGDPPQQLRLPAPRRSHHDERRVRHAGGIRHRARRRRRRAIGGVQHERFEGGHEPGAGPRAVAAPARRASSGFRIPRRRAARRPAGWERHEN